MRITDRLESIMSALADGFPAFAAYLKAKQLIRRYFETLPQDMPVLLLGSQHTDIAYVASLLADTQAYKSLVVDTFNNRKVDVSAVGEVHKIVVVSYYSMLELSHALDLSGLEYECLYEHFISNGLVLQHNWYDYILINYIHQTTQAAAYDFTRCTGYRELHYARKRYRRVNDAVIKAFHLRRMIFICLHMRDFVYAKQYMDEYIANGYTEAERVVTVRDETEALLEQIKTGLSHRTQQDTVMFWLDALEHGDSRYMPFLNDLKDHTLVFENAITVTPYTNPTLRTILTGTKVIDDKSYLITTISRENSRFIRVLDENGVDFVYCGFLSACMDAPHRLRVPFHRDAPTGNIFWSAIETLLSCERPLCLMLHELNNSHEPYISAANDADRFLSVDDFHSFSQIDWAAADRQYMESLKYLDGQLAFYSALLPSAVTKIYFSDHGRTFSKRYHTFLKINGDKIPCQSIRDIFSYVDWDKLMEWLYNPGKRPLASLAREYAEIQEIDRYNGAEIKRELTGKENLGVTRFFSFRGVVTIDEVFILQRDGFERFYNRKANRPPISPERLDTLRRLSGHYFIDPYSDPKFKYACYFYRAIDNYFKRTGRYEQDKTEAIRALFATGQTFAIRTGAEAAFQLLLRLTPDLRQNIKYIIDRDRDCVAGNFGGIEVIDVEKARLLEIDVVIIPSFLWRGLLQTESYGKAKVIDICDYLAGLGFSQNKDFWEYAITSEDIDFEIDD